MTGGSAGGAGGFNLELRKAGTEGIPQGVVEKDGECRAVQFFQHSSFNFQPRGGRASVVFFDGFVEGLEGGVLGAGEDGVEDGFGGEDVGAGANQ